MSRDIMTTPNHWIFKGKEFIDSTGYYGMVYLITHRATGKQYIGRKYFTKSKIQQKTKTKRKKKMRVESDWQTYYGSSADLLEDVTKYGKDNFSREVLRLCVSRGETNYYEAFEILVRGALLSDKFYNKWVSLKLHKATLKNLQPQSSDGTSIPSSKIS